MTNFKKYTQRTFSFEDGTTLISGTSGKGKTTIVEAILFAIRGKQRGDKIVRDGAKSCRVVLRRGGMTIDRTNCPCVLKVTDRNGLTLEDDAAQSLLYRHFPPLMIESSCILQDKFNEFIYKKPDERRQFMEKLIFDRIDVDSHKAKVKLARKNAAKELRDRVSRLKELSSVLRDQESCLEKCDPPSMVVTEEEVERLEKQRTESEWSRRKMEKLLNKTRCLNKEIECVSTEHSSALERIETLESRLPELSEVDGEMVSQTEGLLRDKQKQLQHLEHLSMEKEVMQAINDDKERKEAELQELKNGLLSEDTRARNEKTIETLTSDLCNMRRVEKISKKLDESFVGLSVPSDLDKGISVIDTVIQQGVVYRCPDCRSTLSLQDGKLTREADKKIIEDCTEMIDEFEDREEGMEFLQRVNTNIQNMERLSLLRNKCNTNKNFMKMIDDAESELQQDHDSIRSVKTELNKVKMERDEDNITREKINRATRDMDKHPPYYIKKLKQIKRDKERFRGMEPPECDAEECKEELNTLKDKRQEQLIQLNRKNMITSQILETKKTVDRLSRRERELHSQLGEMPVGMEDDIRLHEEEQERLNKELTQKRRSLSQSVRYKNYLSSLKQVAKTKEKIKVLTKEKDMLDKRLHICDRYKNGFEKRESEFIDRKLKELKRKTERHLAVFFPDNTISVNLSAFKRDKKGNIVKPTLDITVTLDGVDANLSRLSGGERCRVNIAFILAFHSMVNSPLLLFDECTSSLDQELTNVVIEHISRESDGINLVIAHQVIKGQFDHVLELA